MHDPDGVRLQKLLAAAGVGSRRVCENLISQGRVEVDGQVVTELGVRIDATQAVHVDGVRIKLDEDRVYLAFNKPKGVVTTMHDELGRVALGDYVGNREERLFHVGRLDADTEGLLLLTNDGDLAHRLQHPRYGVLKTYVATIRGPVPRDVGKRLREGVELEDGPVRSTRSASSTTSRARRWSRSCSTRAASTSCAGCSRRSATRCSSSCAPRSARSGSPTSSRASGAT